MKITFSIVMLYALLFQFSVKTTLVINYLNNIAEISENCENTDKPELQCFGKCVLTKWVKNVEKHENQQTSLKPYFETEVLFCNTITPKINTTYTIINHSVKQQKQTQNGFVKMLEQPPSQLS